MSIDPPILDTLSAYLDGALSPEDAAAVEALAARDPEIAAELEVLRAVDAAFDGAFADMLHAPVPLALARAIEAAPEGPDAPAAQGEGAPANRASAPRYGWGSLAAGLALLVLGGGMGAYVARLAAPGPAPVAMARGWIADVADYHRVYARQSRHLVEVPAAEQSHIEAWLSKETGVAFAVPDLAAAGLRFEGGRLLVAASKPVAQLVYTDAAGRVVALCFLDGGDASAADGRTALAQGRFEDIETLSWKTGTASYVVVGPAEGVDLGRVAELAAETI